MIKLYVVWLSINRGVFLLQNLYGVEQSIFMILHPKWTSHFIFYTDFGHTLRHEKCTK